MSKYLPFFNEMSFFAGFTLPEMLAVVGSLRERPLRDRELLVRAGNVDQSCFFLVEGQVQVFTTKDKHVRKLALLKRGDIFGHMALFNGGRRSAHCAAKGDALVLEMTFKGYKSLLETNGSAGFKFVDALTCLLVAQLRTTSDQFVELFKPPPGKERADVGKVLNRAVARATGFNLDDVQVVIPEGTRRWGR